MSIPMQDIAQQTPAMQPKSLEKRPRAVACFSFHSFFCWGFLFPKGGLETEHAHTHVSRERQGAEAL
jgi:hypothetical protein